ncbi:MAG: hypothetical protein JO189_23260 [Deltaproteobacteria bacterium]|nr:hypothetical protein [Deltaproteobacteria bacterium]
MNSMIARGIAALIVSNQKLNELGIVKKVIWGLVVIATAVAAKAASVEAGASGKIPLRAGKFSATVQGTFAVCLDPTTFALESCSTAGTLVVPLSLLQNGSGTSDGQGNACANYTEVDTTLPPDNLPPHVTTNEHNVAKFIDYDPNTGTGDVSSTGYVGGRCIGARFDSEGATKTARSTAHVVLSNDGNRTDFIVTQLTNPTSSIGSFSISGFNLDQTKP